MEPTTLPQFARCVLASGLLSAEVLQQAEVELRSQLVPGGATAAPEKATADVTAPEITAPEITVAMLAEKLVESGRLNRWQVQQLLRGRTKFTLGPYRMIDSIGQGGMGQIFKAEHTVMGRIVAVKVLPRHRSTPEAVVNFHREIRAQALLDHANLVRALDAGHDGNVHYLVTEYVPGTDLRKHIRRSGRLSMATAATVISQAAQGLSHAHSKGLIHRDIKPGNLLITADGQTKVSDLGLVSYFAEQNDETTAKGKIVGTADYLAPEQVHSPDSITAAADIYSLGCTLYYAVTGKVPFAGGTVRDKLRAHCEYQPLDPRRLNPDLSVEFVDVLAEMMAKDPAQRPQSAEDVVARLAPWTTGAVVPVATDSAVFHQTPSHSPSHSSSHAPSGQAPSRSWSNFESLVDDSDPSFVMDSLPGNEESTSQISQLTHPISASGEETIPTFDDDESLAYWAYQPQSPIVSLGGKLTVRHQLLIAGLAILAVIGGAMVALYW